MDIKRIEQLKESIVTIRGAQDQIEKILREEVILYDSAPKDLKSYCVSENTDDDLCSLGRAVNDLNEAIEFIEEVI